MEKPEKPESKERNENKPKRGRKQMGSDIYDQHLSVRISQWHFDALDKMIKGRDKTRGEIVRDMIETLAKRLDERDQKGT